LLARGFASPHRFVAGVIDEMDNRLIEPLMFLLSGYLLLRRSGSAESRGLSTEPTCQMNLEAQRRRDGYEEQKRKLLIALRRKISEKNTEGE
jgi:hypothetical protein